MTVMAVEVTDLPRGCARVPLHFNLGGATAPHGHGECRHGVKPGSSNRALASSTSSVVAAPEPMRDARTFIIDRRRCVHRGEPPRIIASRLVASTSVKPCAQTSASRYRPYSDCDPYAASVARTPAVTTLLTVSEAQP